MYSRTAASHSRSIWTALTLSLSLGVSLFAAKTPQVEANHMRWENHDALLAQAVAWQEERDGHWVTMVLLTDRPVAPSALRPGASPASLMDATKAQGLAVAVMTGGVPLPDSSVDVAYRDGADIRTTVLTGAGGFEIESQSATRIKGKVVLHPFTLGEKDASAWSVSFDTAVLRGDARKMDAEGEAVGAAAQPARDFAAFQAAKLAMDYAALSASAPSDMVDFLKDAASRQRNLAMLKSMTPPQSTVLGGLRRENRVRLYWAQQWPNAADSRCVETLVLESGKWRSTESACQGE